MRYVIRRNRQGKYWWRLVANNGEILAASELMEEKRSCEHAIALVKANASTAPIEDMTHETKERGSV